MSASLAVILVSLVEMPPVVKPPPQTVMLARSVEDDFVFQRFLLDPDDSIDAMIAESGGMPIRRGPYHIYFATIGAEPDALPAGSLFAAPDETPALTSFQPVLRWLAVLLALGLVATILGSVGAARRPLPIAASAVRQPTRSVSLVERLLVLVCLWSPLLMLFGLLQAEHGLLSTVLLASSALGAGACGMMLSARRRLLQRLRWALGGRLDRVADGTLVSAEIEAKRLVAPPGMRGAVPWFRADLCVMVPGESGPAEPARIALDDVLVDDDTARLLLSVALGKSSPGRLTVVGEAQRAPADAHSAGALERIAPTQARILGGRSGRALLVAGAPADLVRRLEVEGLLLSGALAASIGAALVTMLS